jgi:flagellar biosynthesis/type III secretory pathway chaperone
MSMGTLKPENIQTFLDDLLVLYKTVLEVLRTERACLVANDLEGLASCSEKKFIVFNQIHERIQQFQSLHHLRNPWMMRDLIAHQSAGPEHKALTARLDTLRTLTQHAATQNQHNRNLVTLALTQTQERKLRVLLPPKPPATYGATGKKVLPKPPPGAVVRQG